MTHDPYNILLTHDPMTRWPVTHCSSSLWPIQPMAHRPMTQLTHWSIASSHPSTHITFY